METGPNKQFASLSSVKARVAICAPLPFNVYAADSVLLLAKGQLIDTGDQLAALFERGSLVDVSDLLSENEQLRQLPRDKLPERLGTGLERGRRSDAKRAAHRRPLTTMPPPS